MKLIDIDEVIAMGDRLIEQAVQSPVSVVPDALRDWYDRTLAERTERYNRISTPAGLLEVGHRYDITITQHRYGQRVPTHATLRGWVVDGRAGYAGRRATLHKPVHGRPEFGTRREVDLDDIREIVEVVP